LQSKVLPPPFLAARDEALNRARKVEMRRINEAAIHHHDNDDHHHHHPYENGGGDLYDHHHLHQQPEISYDAGDVPLYDDDNDPIDEPFDQQQERSPRDSYQSFEPQQKYNPYDRFTRTTAARSSYHPYHPSPQGYDQPRHGRMEPPDGNEFEEDPTVFEQQQNQRLLQLQQQQHHSRQPQVYGPQSQLYHDHDRRPDPTVLHSAMDPPEDEPPSLRKKTSSSSRYVEPHQQEQAYENCSDDQFTEPFAEPHDSYEPVDDYYDEGRLEYPDYGSPEYVESPDGTSQYDDNRHPIVITSPTASDGDFTDPTIGTFTPRRHRVAPTSPSRSSNGTTSLYSPASALANDILLRRSRKQEYHNQDALTPLSQRSATTWDTDGTSEFGSSVWTENEPDRTSRRALILQMAKARMKNTTSAIGGGCQGGKSNFYHQDEKKLADVDLRGDLD
jgi:hypothetical protein